ncbi:Plus3 domain-containing protein [Abeliophyllum distichum]|uniref:Plus3 domain-containing protein n=1 Tax=Abeliophyllum distichum TaxID=126358 RepID=A0ABD1V7K9_9LAMI
MSSEVGSDSGKEAISWGRGQEEASSGRLVEGIDEDEVLSPAPLTAVPPRVSSTEQAGTRGERVVESGNIGRRAAEVASGLRTAHVWKCRFFPSEVSEGQLREWHQTYRVPDDIEFVVPGPDDRADDPPLGTVALNQAILAAGLRLPFPRVVRKFLQEWGIAPTQLCPNGWGILIGLLVLWDHFGFPRPSIGDFHSLYSSKSDGKRSGWWPDLSIPVRYHELRYVAREPTEESAKRARRARKISENLRSSAVLITEENLISARLSCPLSDRHTARRKTRAQARPARGRERSQLGTRNVPPGQDWSPISPPALRGVRRGAWRRSRLQPPLELDRPPAGPQLQPTYLGSTAEKDEEFLRLWGTLPKPVRDFLMSNSPTREEIAGLPLSSRRAIRSVAKCGTPVQQKYLDSMGVVDSVVAASVNVSRAAIQLSSASEKMARLVSDVQVMRDEGRKVLEELENEKRLWAASEDILLRREEELNAKVNELERAVKARADLEADLEAERKKNSELTAVLENSTAKEEAVAEFRSSDTFLVEQEVVYFLTMEELIESTAEKRPDWDLQFLKDELADLKRKSTLNPPSPEEADPDQSGGDQDQAGAEE